MGALINDIYGLMLLLLWVLAIVSIPVLIILCYRNKNL